MTKAATLIGCSGHYKLVCIRRGRGGKMRGRGGRMPRGFRGGRGMMMMMKGFPPGPMRGRGRDGFTNGFGPMRSCPRVLESFSALNSCRNILIQCFPHADFTWAGRHKPHKILWETLVNKLMKNDFLALLQERHGSHVAVSRHARPARSRLSKGNEPGSTGSAASTTSAHAHERTSATHAQVWRSAHLSDI